MIKRTTKTSKSDLPKPEVIANLEKALTEKQLEFLRGIHADMLSKMACQEFEGWDLEGTPVDQWLWFSLLDMFVGAAQKMHTYQDLIEDLKAIVAWQSLPPKTAN